VTTTVAAGRTQAVAGRSVFLALAARELRRFVVNPIFLFGVGMTAWIVADPDPGVLEIDSVAGYPAVFLGGFGMMAMFWLTRSMRDSEPVVGVTPTALPVRTAALCAVAIVPFLCGCVALAGFVTHTYPIGSPLYGAFSEPTQVAILVGQIAVPTLGGPLLGVTLGRWVSFPGAGFVLFLVIFGWLELVTIPSLTHPDAVPAIALRLFSPFTFWSFADDGPDVTLWPGSPWFFIGWQLALCAIAVLVALLRGAEGRMRFLLLRALVAASGLAAVMFVLANVAGVTRGA
jgi:hypothetical protein